jgi:hypothetical protein
MEKMGSLVDAQLEASSNVCCHGRGMLQWDQEKVKPQRGEPGTSASARSWRISGRRRGGDDSRVSDCHLIIDREDRGELCSHSKPPTGPPSPPLPCDGQPRSPQTFHSASRRQSTARLMHTQTNSARNDLPFAVRPCARDNPFAECTNAKLHVQSPSPTLLLPCRRYQRPHELCFRGW